MFIKVTTNDETAGIEVTKRAGNLQMSIANWEGGKMHIAWIDNLEERMATELVQGLLQAFPKIKEKL